MSTPQQPGAQPSGPPPAVAAHYERLNRRRRRRLIKVLDPGEEKRLAKRFGLGMLVSGALPINGTVGLASQLSQQGFTWTHLDIADAYRRVAADTQSPDPRTRSLAEQTLQRINPWMNRLLVPTRGRPAVPDFTPEHDWVLYSVAEYLVSVNAPVR